MLAACHDSTTPADAAGGDAQSFATVTGRVRDSNGNGIENATVCILNNPTPCVSTDGSGDFTFQVPSLPGADLAVEIAAPGYLGVTSLAAEPAESVGTTATIFPADITLLTDPEATTMLGSAGFTYPGSGGFLQLRLSGDTAADLSGATVSMSPPAGTGPIYVDVDGNPNASLTSSTTNGYAELGNVPAGQYSLTASAAGKTCTVRPSPAGSVAVGDWPPTSPGSTTQIEIADAAFTLGVVIYCL